MTTPNSHAHSFASAVPLLGGMQVLHSSLPDFPASGDGGREEPPVLVPNENPPTLVFQEIQQQNFLVVANDSAENKDPTHSPPEKSQLGSAPGTPGVSMVAEEVNCAEGTIILNGTSQITQGDGNAAGFAHDEMVRTSCRL